MGDACLRLQFSHAKLGKLVYLRWPTVWRFPFGKLPSSQPTPNRFPFHPQGAADSRLGLAGLKQGEDFLVALQPPLSAQLRLRRLGWHDHRNIGGDSGDITGVGGWRSGRRIIAGWQDQLSTSLLEHPFHRCREIQDEMEPIGYLLGLRRSQCCAFGIQTTSITRDRDDFGVLSEPCREALGRPVRNEIDDASEVEINQNCSKVLAQPKPASTGPPRTVFGERGWMA